MLARNHLKQCAAVFLWAAAMPCFADSAQSPNASLTPVSIKHTVECPLPTRQLCVIRKPVGAGYRVLTQGINLEDAGEYWIADFTKTKPVDRTRKVLIRVMGKDNDVHDIEVSFKSPEKKSVARNTPQAKSPEEVKAE